MKAAWFSLVAGLTVVSALALGTESAHAQRWAGRGAGVGVYVRPGGYYGYGRGYYGRGYGYGRPYYRGYYPSYYYGSSYSYPNLSYYYPAQTTTSYYYSEPTEGGRYYYYTSNGRRICHDRTTGKYWYWRGDGWYRWS